LAIVGVALFEVTLGPDPTRRERFGLGTTFGAGWLYMGMGWMWQLTAPGYIFAGLVFSLLHGLAALAAPTGRWRTIGRPAAHTLVEALRCALPFGGVPLATLGISQAGSPLAGIARVGGVILITWVVFQLGFAVPVLIAGTARRRTPGLALGGFAAALLVAALAMVAPRGASTGELLDIAGVQGGGEQGTRAIDVPTRIVTDRHLAATAAIEPDLSLDLVLWPENVIDTEAFATSEELDQVTEQAQRLGVPFAVGITEDVPGRPGRISNAEVIVTPAGEVTSRYDKVRRVPFGEYVPLRGLLEALGAPVDQVRTNAVPGTGPAVLDLPNGDRVGVVISWEVFFGGRAREGVREGATVILNPTNGASYTGTIVQTQQIASSRLRAIETGRWVLQAAPTGFSAFITPTGEVIDRTAVSEQAVIRHAVELRTGETWYVRLGDAPIIVAGAAMLAAAWAASQPMRRRRTPPEPQPDTETALVPDAVGADRLESG
jgi:apolipoprotein N-acyltransferase